MMPCVAGLDLAGSERRPTGFAVLRGRRFSTGTLLTDRELLEFCEGCRPSLIAIDAPLNFPDEGSLRPCDRELISRGLRVFPPTFAGMRKLTERGIRISSLLRSAGLEVIEVHPRTSGVLIFGAPERSVWLRRLRLAGFRLDPASDHEVDAAISALTALLHLRGLTEVVGGEGGAIVIPAPAASLRALLRKRCCSRKPS